MVELGSGDVTYANEDTGAQRVLARDVPANSRKQEDVVSVALCGQGELFAVVVPRELAVHDGRSGARLAHAPTTRRLVN